MDKMWLSAKGVILWSLEKGGHTEKTIGSAGSWRRGGHEGFRGRWYFILGLREEQTPLGKGLRQRNSRVRGAGEMESRAVLSIWLPSHHCHLGDCLGSNATFSTKLSLLSLFQLGALSSVPVLYLENTSVLLHCIAKNVKMNSLKLS